MSKVSCLILIIGFFIMSIQSCLNIAESDILKEEKKIEYISDLEESLTTKPQWEKVHVAEYLITLGNTGRIREIFQRELKEFKNEPRYRIGIYRVLAQVSDDREEWINRVLDVFGDESAPDRIHAAETLAKLKTSPIKRFPQKTKEILSDSLSVFSVYTRWAVESSISENQAETEFFNKIIKNKGIENRLRNIALYALKHLKVLEEKDWMALFPDLFEQNDDELMANLLSTAYLTAPPRIKSSKSFNWLHEEMIKYITSATDAIGKIEIIKAMAELGENKDFKIIMEQLVKQEMVYKGNKEAKLGEEIDALHFALLRLNKRMK